MHDDKVTLAGMAAGWGGWFFSHLVQLNELLQFVLFLASLFLTILAIIHRLRSTRR